MDPGTQFVWQWFKICFLVPAVMLIVATVVYTIFDSLIESEKKGEGRRNWGRRADDYDDD